MTSATVPEAELPLELTPASAVEAAYPAELATCHQALRQGLPVLVECDKEMSPWFYRSLRQRLKADGRRCVYLDGRPAPGAEPSPMGSNSVVSSTIAQLTDAVRGAVEERTLVLPHLDLLTTSTGGLTSEAREVISLLYENPAILFLGFKDPSFPLPRVISALFPRHVSILGIPRDRLRHLVTQREARKLGRSFSPYQLYKYVSGLNAVRLRRLLSALTGEDYPDDPQPAFEQLRSATLTGGLTIPNVDLDRDIGGYRRVKRRLRQEIIEVLGSKDQLGDLRAIRRVEGLLPRGMIFWGPPGTGKTLFAKAMATSLGAAVTVVSGPELKSKWVGESEENLRAVFRRARQSAPAVIIFDELDSFATARGTYASSGVEHSMVNQLLTEMDGFRNEELVFVVATTNFAESLDPALLRPGRFEFQLHIPYPDRSDRKEILSIYDHKLDLQMSERALDYAARRTGDLVETTGTPYSGDHLQALCRQVARDRLRGGLEEPTEVADLERALDAYLERPALTGAEERVVATHEAGHAVCALLCDKIPPIERISIRGDLAGALGFVRYGDPANRHVTTRGQLLDSLCVLFGGREAEALLLDDQSIGAAMDLERATAIARSLVEEFGFGSGTLSARQFRSAAQSSEPPLSEATRAALDEEVSAVAEEQRQRSRRLLEAHRELVVALRDLLLERKVLDRTAFAHLLEHHQPEAATTHTSEDEAPCQRA